MSRTLTLKLSPISDSDIDRVVEIGEKSATAIGDRYSFTRSDVIAMRTWARMGTSGFLGIRDDGTLVGIARYLQFLDAQPPLVVAQLTVDPEFRHNRVGAWAHDQVLEKAKSDGADYIDGTADIRDKEAMGFLNRRGFERLVNMWTMEADPDFAPGEEPQAPRGYQLRDYVPGQDTQLLTDMFNQTFDKHVTFFPCTVEDTRSIENTPMFDPGLTKILERDDGTPVAYARNSVRGDAKDAWVDVLGVLPEAQGLGLGRFMLVHSMYLLAQFKPRAIRLVVEGTNDKARALYDSEGFMEICTRMRFRKKLA